MKLQRQKAAYSTRHTPQHSTAGQELGCIFMRDRVAWGQDLEWGLRKWIPQGPRQTWTSLGLDILKNGQICANLIGLFVKVKWNEACAWLSKCELWLATEDTAKRRPEHYPSEGSFHLQLLQIWKFKKGWICVCFSIHTHTESACLPLYSLE